MIALPLSLSPCVAQHSRERRKQAIEEGRTRDDSDLPPLLPVPP